jgi:hypothetical protein
LKVTFKGNTNNALHAYTRLLMLSKPVSPSVSD